MPFRARRHGRQTANSTKAAARLARASRTERQRIEPSPSGYGIHWPLIDEDLAVAPLFGCLSNADALSDFCIAESGDPPVNALPRLTTTRRWNS